MKIWRNSCGDEGVDRRNEKMFIAYIEFKIFGVSPFTIRKCTINYVVGLNIQVGSQRSEFKYILIGGHILRML